MVVLVPVAFGAPPVLVFIPPAMALPPATFACLVQFTTLVLGLPAVASMSLDGLVEFMLRMSDSALAAVYVFRMKARHRGEEQGCGQDRTRKNKPRCGRKFWLTIHETVPHRVISRNGAPAKWTERGDRFSGTKTRL